MRTCDICEGLLAEAQFQDDEPICNICRLRVKQEDDIEFAEPEQRTVKQSYFELLLAIREQAVLDNKASPESLSDWESYWLKVDPWPRIWVVLRDGLARGEVPRDAGGYVMSGGKS